ncbi:MAG: YqgE/AlgH family protein [Gammaproteobacteria bacterium]|nr:YqgE/AlgH family protein [Gammaproteobacteria bacterium]
MSNHFLIAMPHLRDPNFFHGVTFVCEHNENGAMGIVINRPMPEITLGEVFEQLGLTTENQNLMQQAVFFGGPVERERGFVVHQPIGTWSSTLTVAEELGVTSSRDIIEALTRDEGPKRTFIALGYAGWGPGQLEKEITDNSWLSLPADPRLIFDVPIERRWEEAARLLGIDINSISSDVGHA